jgi:hypothetical protein
MINGHGTSNKESDECYTPRYAVEPIIKYIPKGKIIWCPFEGEDSEYVKVLRENGFEVIFSHIKQKKDFFKYEPKEYDLIISNPPFSLADEILERLYKLNKPFMILFPLKYLQAIGRGKLFIKHGIQLLTFDKRIGYYINGNMSKPKEGNYQASSYFCWKILSKDLIIEILNKDSSKTVSTTGDGK